MVALILAMATEAMVEDMGALSFVSTAHLSSATRPGTCMAVCNSYLCNMCVAVCNVSAELQAVPRMHSY